MKKTHRVLKFNHKDWQKPYLKMEHKHKTEANNHFEKIFFKLMNTPVFGKTGKMYINIETIFLTRDQKS